MLTQPGLRFISIAAAAVLVVSISVASARAGVGTEFLEQLEGLQKADGATHQWKFEGDSDLTRLRDSAGPNKLNLLKVGGAGGATNPDGMPETGDEGMLAGAATTIPLIGFEPGYDGTSQAYRPYAIPVNIPTEANGQLSQTRHGAGLYTPLFTPTGQMTVEAVIKPDVYDSVRALSYLLQGRNGERLFFGAQTAKTDPFAPPGGNLTTVIGTEFTPAAVLDPMTMEVIQPAGRPAAIPNYVAGHWYYVAALFDLSNPGTMPPTNGARVTYYYADLTTGGPLIKSLDEHLFRFTSAIFNPVRMGVGLFVIGDPAANLVEGAPTGAQEFYRGSIENLTMYNPLLSEAEILQHLRALRVDGVPEPASLLLVSLGALAMLMFARRAR